MRYDWLLLIGAAALVVACGGPEAPQAQDAAEAPRQSVIGEPLHQALDRAEGVQSLVDEQAEETRRRIEEAEGR
jgi:hypothetical protein